MLSVRTSFDGFLRDIALRHHNLDKVLLEGSPAKGCLALQHPALAVEIKMDGERQIVHISRGVVTMHVSSNDCGVGNLPIHLTLCSHSTVHLLHRGISLVSRRETMYGTGVLIFASVVESNFKTAACTIAMFQLTLLIFLASSQSTLRSSNCSCSPSCHCQV